MVPQCGQNSAVAADAVASDAWKAAAPSSTLAWCVLPALAAIVPAEGTHTALTRVPALVPLALAENRR